MPKFGEVAALTEQLIGESTAGQADGSRATSSGAAGVVSTARADLPVVRATKRPRREDVVQAAATPIAREAIIARFVQDVWGSEY